MFFPNLPSSECLTDPKLTPHSEVLFAVLSSPDSQTKKQILDKFENRPNAHIYMLEWLTEVSLINRTVYFYSYFANFIRKKWNFIDDETRIKMEDVFIKTFKNKIRSGGSDDYTFSYFPVFIELIKKEYPFKFNEGFFEKLNKWFQKYYILTKINVINFLGQLGKACTEEKDQKFLRLINDHKKQICEIFVNIFKTEKTISKFIKECFITVTVFFDFVEPSFFFENNIFQKLFDFSFDYPEHKNFALRAIGKYLQCDELPEEVYQLALSNPLFNVILSNIEKERETGFIEASLFYLEGMTAHCAKVFVIEKIGEIIDTLFSITHKNKNNSKIFSCCLDVWVKISKWARETVESPNETMREVYYQIFPDVIRFFIDSIRMNDEEETYEKESLIIANLSTLEFLEFDDAMYEQISSLKEGFENEQLDSLTATIIALKRQGEEHFSLVNDTMTTIMKFITNKSLSSLNASNVAVCFLEILTNYDCFGEREIDYYHQFVDFMKSKNNLIQKVAVDKFKNLAESNTGKGHEISPIQLFVEDANSICASLFSNELLSEFIESLVKILQKLEGKDVENMFYDHVVEPLIQQMTEHFETKDLLSISWINEVITLITGLKAVSINSFGSLSRCIEFAAADYVNLLNSVIELMQIPGELYELHEKLKNIILEFFTNYANEYHEYLDPFLLSQLTDIVVTQMQSPLNRIKSPDFVNLAAILIQKCSFSQTFQFKKLYTTVVAETSKLVNNGESNYNEPFISFVLRTVDNINIICNEENSPTFLKALILLNNEHSRVAEVHCIITRFIQEASAISSDILSKEILGSFISEAASDLFFGEYKFAFNEIFDSFIECLKCINAENADYLRRIITRILYFIPDEDASTFVDSLIEKLSDIKDLKKLLRNFLVFTMNFTEDEIPPLE